MCFENLPVEFDENGNAHLKEGVKNPYDYQTRTPEEREAKCRVTLKSETRRVRGYFLPLIMRFHCHRAYAFRALPGDVIDRGKQTWLLIEGAQ